MWSRNTLTDHLGLDCPIILAPMAGATTPELAAAVSNAGGLGSLGLATSPTDAAEEQIAAFRALSNRSLNINFFCHADPGDVSDTGAAMRARLQPYYTAKGLGDVPVPRVPYGPFGPEQLDLVLRHRPRVVSFHFGLPQPELLSSVKSSGAFVMSSATTVAEALWLEAQGVDAVIAQGLEAGGHRGTFLETDPTCQAGLFALLPQITSAVRVPVVAAGGIADGRGVAAALVLGASAVQIGTAFLRCPEAAVHPLHRAALATARDDGTCLTCLISGKPARMLRNRFIDELKDAEALTAPFPAQMAITGPLLRGSADPDFLPMLAGQAAALSREMAAGDLVRMLTTETAGCLSKTV